MDSESIYIKGVTTTRSLHCDGHLESAISLRLGVGANALAPPRKKSQSGQERRSRLSRENYSRACNARAPTGVHVLLLETLVTLDSRVYAPRLRLPERDYSPSLPLELIYKYVRLSRFTRCVSQQFE